MSPQFINEDSGRTGTFKIFISLSNKKHYDNQKMTKNNKIWIVLTIYGFLNIIFFRNRKRSKNINISVLSQLKLYFHRSPHYSTVPRYLRRNHFETAQFVKIERERECSDYMRNWILKSLYLIILSFAVNTYWANFRYLRNC